METLFFIGFIAVVMLVPLAMGAVGLALIVNAIESIKSSLRK